MICVYCGQPSGAYDEHDACVERAAAEALVELEADAAGEQRNRELVQAHALLSRERGEPCMEGGWHAH